MNIANLTDDELVAELSVLIRKSTAVYRSRRQTYLPEVDVQINAFCEDIKRRCKPDLYVRAALRALPTLF
jgi:hypothetical protein